MTRADPPGRATRCRSRTTGGPPSALYGSHGTTADIPGDSEHAFRNTGTVQLRFSYAFAVGSLDEIEYRFTSK